MTDLPVEILNLGPTAGVIVVVWAFLRFLSQQREAHTEEAAQEREELRKALDHMAAAHERALVGISGKVDRLTEAQHELTKAIETTIRS